MPLPKNVVENVMKLSGVGPGKKFYDLGSGDGRVVMAAAMRGAEAMGVEIDKIRVLYSKLWIKLLRIKNAQIIEGNLFNADIKDADIVHLYLLEETNGKLRPKLEKELKRGVVVIASGFPVPGWEPSSIDKNGPPYGPIYVYQKK